MSVAAQNAVDRSNGQAIGIMCIGVLCLVTNDAMPKWLTAYYPPLQIIFVRNLLALPMIAAIVLARHGVSAMRTRHPGVHALRGVFAVVAAFAFFSGIRVLPLAEATALVFAAPIFITALSVPLLKEHVGWRRWMAVVAGFVGVLIIVRPGAATFQPASLFIVAAAALYALFMISARWIEKDEGFWTMTLYVVLFPLFFSGAIVLFQWEEMALAHLPLFLALAVFGTLGVTLIGHAFRLGQAAVVAPFDYTALVWASLFGWLVWGDVPQVRTYAGAAVIVASGIYIVFRESRARSG